MAVSLVIRHRAARFLLCYSEALESTWLLASVARTSSPASNNHQYDGTLDVESSNWLARACGLPIRNISITNALERDAT